MGTDLGVAFEQSLRYFARDVHALRGGRSGRHHCDRYALELAGGRAIDARAAQDRPREGDGAEETGLGRRDRHGASGEAPPALPGESAWGARRFGRDAIPDPRLEVRQQASQPRALIRTAHRANRRASMRENRIRTIWKAGGAVLNGWLAIPNAFSAETMAHQGWDSLTIDLQHGVVDYQSMIPMLQAISTTSTVPLVRV